MSKITPHEAFNKLGAEMDENDKKAEDLAAVGMLVPTLKQRLEKMIQVLDTENNVMISIMNHNEEIDNLAQSFGLTKEKKQNLLRAISQVDLNPEVGKEAIKVALYYNLLEEPEAGKAISGVVSSYVSKHSTKDTTELNNKVYKITTPVIDETNPLETKGLKEASTRIVDAYRDKSASLSFSERVGKIWRSFVDSLPTIREASKVRESIRDYTVAKTPAMTHRANGKIQEQSKGRG